MTTKTTNTTTVAAFAAKLKIEDTHARALLNLMKTQGLATVETIKDGSRGKGKSLYTFIPDAATKFQTILKTALTTTTTTN